MIEVYKIVLRQDHNIVYASGFYGLERAQHWLDTYDPRMWMDKTIPREALEIIRDSSL